MDQRINPVVYVKVLGEPKKFLLSVRPGKAARGNGPRRAGIELSTSGLDRLFRLSYEARQQQVSWVMSMGKIRLGKFFEF